MIKKIGNLLLLKRLRSMPGLAALLPAKMGLVTLGLAALYETNCE